MPAIPAVVGIAGLGLQAKGQSDAKKAASQAAQAAQNAGVNIPQVQQLASQQAIANARNSAALEQELNPLAPQLRTAGMQGVLNNLQGQAPQIGQYGPRGQGPADVGYAQIQQQAGDPQYQQGLTQMFNGPYREMQQQALPGYQDFGQSALTQGANAEAMRQLQLGGKLDAETANQVMRAGAARGAMVGGGGMGLGRDVSARDLGLTSLQLQQQRMGTANLYGQQADQFGAQQAASRNLYNGQTFDRGFAQNQANMGYGLQQDQMRQNLGFGLNAMGQQDREYALRVQQQNIANQMQAFNQNMMQKQFAEQQYGADRGDFNYNQAAQQQRYQQGVQNNLAGAQFGQGIAQPVTGLDPSAIANLAVGNSNAQQSGLQNSLAMKANAAGGMAQLGGGLMGMGLNAYMNKPATTGGWTGAPMQQGSSYATSAWVPPPTNYGAVGVK